MPDRYLINENSQSVLGRAKEMARLEVLLVGVSVFVCLIIAIGCCEHMKKRTCSRASRTGLTHQEAELADEYVAHLSKLKSKGQRRLLCEGDWTSLLEACRELLHRVDAGDLHPGEYSLEYDPPEEVSQFPQPIVELGFGVVCVQTERVVIAMMGGLDHFGVNAYQKNYTPPSDDFKYGDRELIPGLWYYDDGYREAPAWYGKKIDTLIENGINRKDK